MHTARIQPGAIPAVAKILAGTRSGRATLGIIPIGTQDNMALSLDSAWGLLGGSSMGMYCEAGSTKAIRGAKELRGSRYTKHHTTKVIGAAFRSGPYVTKNLASALTTGPPASAMLRMGRRASF